MTPFGRSLEGDGYGPTRISAPKSGSNENANERRQACRPRHGRVTEQIPAFAAIGFIGYFVDAGITYSCAKYLGMSPELARPPGFIIATIVNFTLNRLDHLPPVAGAARRRFHSLLRRRLPRARGQLRRLLGLRRFGPAPWGACHASDPAAVRRRRERRGDGSHLCRVSILRLSTVKIVDCLAQSAIRRAMIASKRCGSSA